jgi:hypothetical protein
LREIAMASITVRRRAACAAAVALAALMFATAARAQAPAALSFTKPAGERRIALVIGNGAYQAGPVLANPVNDARAMATKLKAVGFEVIEVENGGQQIMLRAIAQFSTKLDPDTVSLFYYAGHGMQVNGRNYLIPVDAEISTEQTVRLATVDVDAVIEQMSMAKSRINLVILDACRNNPFERRFRSQSGGLATIDAPTGTLIAYATSPGKVAADGDTGNGLYTSELVKAIDVPGAKVEDVFKHVRANVVERSRGDQTPWEASSLTGDFYFLGPTNVVVSPGAGSAPADRDIVYWTSVKDSGNPALLQAYLDEFPQGTFAGAAKILIDDLKQKQVAAAAAPAKPDVAPPPAESPLAIEEIEGAYVTVKRANLREKPLADGKLVKALEPGAALTVTGKVKETQWYRVASADGKLRGFVFGDAIQDTKAAEEAEWQRIKDAKQSAAPTGFLRRYPASVHADEAKALRDTLLKAEQANAASQPAGPARSQGGTTAPSQQAMLAPRPDDARPGYPGWLPDSRSGCRVWTSSPHEGETLTWSGACGPDGHATGSGTIEWRYADKVSRYTGDVRDGKENGRGVADQADGSHYEGEVRDGKANGTGKLVNSSGNRYEGEWRDGKRNGHGTSTLTSGARFEGEYHDDKLNGYAVFNAANGDHYEGQWRDNRPNGAGTATIGKSTFNGTWNDGCFKEFLRRAAVARDLKTCP